MATAMSVSAVSPAAAVAAARRRTLVCVPATARAPREMAAELAAAAALGADVAELRLDRLAGFAPRRDLPVILAEPRPLPALVTYRWGPAPHVIL
jgi:3-dehydroquinate dehydratase/shikimate dehydrogenase